jgi:hypothetical protein
MYITNPTDRDLKQENQVNIEKPPQTDSEVETLDQSAMVDTRIASEGS